MGWFTSDKELRRQLEKEREQFDLLAAELRKVKAERDEIAGKLAAIRMGETTVCWPDRSRFNVYLKKPGDLALIQRLEQRLQSAEGLRTIRETDLGPLRIALDLDDNATLADINKAVIEQVNKPDPLIENHPWFKSVRDAVAPLGVPTYLGDPGQWVRMAIDAVRNQERVRDTGNVEKAKRYDELAALLRNVVGVEEPEDEFVDPE